jgi:LDH2 family malate/lactate/ureidoglycolate dehydrogenase
VSVRLSIVEAQTLANAALMQLGFDAPDAAIAMRHLIDAELRGLGYAGFGRLVSIAEQIDKRGLSQQPITILKETPVSARLDGGDQLGLVVAQRATEIAIAKAATSGIAIVGASNTWYTGMLSFYAEFVATQDLVVMVASNATARVAPYGGNERRMGANPICFGFPSTGAPVVWDIGTSAVGHAQVMLARRLGLPLEEGVAFGADGRPTTDPSAALAGAFVAWGGHRGSGLGIVVQLLGILAGSSILPGELQDFGYLMVAVQPELLTPLAEFKKAVAVYSDFVRATRPVEQGKPLRMPYDRSRAERNARLASGIEVPDAIHATIARIAAGR